MLKKLRVKFILMMMSFTILLLGSIFGLIYHFTAADLAQSSFEMMQAVALRPSRPERPGSAPDSVRLPFFTVEVSKTGTITTAGSDLYDLSDEDFLRELVLAAQADGKNDGLLSSYHLRFFRAVTPDGEKYVFADTSAEQATLHGLIHTSVLIGLGSLAVFFALSVLLARWAVRPVELAWRQQKQFVADASHELKTPLSVILTNAELLQSAQGEETRQRFSANVLTAATQMRALVSGLLDLARSDQAGLSSARERLDWSKTALDACLPFEPVFFERGLTFSYDVEPGLFVLGDAAQLARCVDILLDNAQKYTEPGGDVHLALSRCGKARCRLCVSSTGEPLSPADCRKIFERFARLDGARHRDGSYGLGLSIAESIVSRHGGKIRAEGADHENRFFIDLPLCKESLHTA